MTTFADVRWVVEGESDPNARIAELERALAQEKARNAELGEQLRAAREATREAVDREGALVTQRNYARDKVERLERWLASAKALHLEDVGRLSKCISVPDTRALHLEDVGRLPKCISVPDTRALHLEDVGRLSKCLEVRDARVAELEEQVKDLLARPPVSMVSPGNVAESWVRDQWEQSRALAELEVRSAFPASQQSTDGARLRRCSAHMIAFAERMGWQ